MVAARPRPAGGAPNVVLIVLDDVGYAQLGCYGSDIDTPEHRPARRRRRAARQLPHDRAVLADALVPADRAQPPLERHGPRRRPRGRLPRLLRPHPPPQRLPLRDPRRERLRDRRGRQVAPHAGGRDAHGRAARHAGRSVAASSAGTGSTAARPTSSCPTLFQDNHAVPPPRTPEDGYHLSEDLADRAIQYLGDLRAGRARAAVLPLLRDRRVPLAAPRAAPSGSSATAGQFDEGWDAWRERDVRPPAGELGLLPDGHRALAPPAVGARVGRPRRPRTSAVAARFMECFAGFLSHADAQIGRVLAFIEELGERDNTLVVARLRQRRERRGRRARLDQRRRGSGTASRPAAASCARASTSSAARPRTTTTRGAGRWPATRRSGAGSARCTKAASPTRASCTGRAGSPAAARSATSSRTRSTCCPPILELIGIDAAGRDRRRRADARSRARASPTVLRRRRRAGSATRRSTSRCSAAAAIYHDGWKAVTFKPLGAMYDDGLDPDAPFDDDVWELYHVAEDFSECDDLAGAGTRAARRDGRRCGGRRRARYQVLPLDNRPLAALLQPAPDRAGDRDALRLLPGRRAGPRDRRASTCATAPTRSPPTSTCPERRTAEGVLLAMGTVLGGWSFHAARRTAALRAQPRRQGAPPRRRPTSS